MKKTLEKHEILDVLMLLSALESWGFSTKTMFPDYLHDDLCRNVNLLKSVILEKEEK